MTFRNQAPSLKLQNNFQFAPPQTYIMANGCKLLVVSQGDVDVCRVDLVFNAGSRYQTQRLVANGTFSLMSEGTAKHTSQQISEHFDYWGSFTGFGADKDYAKATAFSLTKHLDQTLDMMQEILTMPIYPVDELNEWKRRSKQSLTVEMEKASTKSRIGFFNALYGEGHPYGAFAVPTDFELIEQDSLIGYHKQFVGSKNCTVVLSGRVTDAHIAKVQSVFGNHSWGDASETSISQLSEQQVKGQSIFIEKADALQSSIRVGRPLFTRSHPDYPDLAIVNTILGGYFGSRLMKNIREEKGYTYGIGSYIVTLKDSGALVISTEVGEQYTQQTMLEITKEIERLQNEPVGQDELLRVQSYLMGEALRSINGPFAIADNVLSLFYFNNLNYEFFNGMVNSIKAITPNRVMEIANKWLKVDDFVHCVVAKSNPF